jgi:hypothetical protein
MNITAGAVSVLGNASGALLVRANFDTSAGNPRQSDL